MDWTTDNCPAAIKSLADESIRARAIDEANKLREEGYGPVRALSMGIARAQDAADRKDDSTIPGAAYYVVLDSDEWHILREDEAKPTHRFDRMQDAIVRAQELARESRSAVYVLLGDQALVEKFEPYGPTDSPGEGYHVMPFEDGWVARQLAPNGEFKKFATKREASTWARKEARSHDGELFVHYRSGDVQQSVRYGGAEPS